MLNQPTHLLLPRLLYHFMMVILWLMSNYQCIVGALQNVTITQTNISFVVNRVCQLMNLNTAHWQIVKRILQYLQGLISQGLKTTSPLLDLTAYSDVGWTGDSHDRRPTIGVCVYFGLNLPT